METAHILIAVYSFVSFYLLIMAMISRDASFPMVVGILFWPLLISCAMILVIFAFVIYLLSAVIITAIYAIFVICAAISSIFKRKQKCKHSK